MATTASKNLGLKLPASTNPDMGDATGTHAGQLTTAVNALDLAYGNVQKITAAGAINITSGTVFLQAGSAAAVTLPAAIAGLPGAGGNDGQCLSVISLDAFAYTVTTPANAINGSKHIATWAAAIANGIEFIAFGGVWYQNGTPPGVTLS